jgi:hypothetical protein
VGGLLGEVAGVDAGGDDRSPTPSEAHPASSPVRMTAAARLRARRLVVAFIGVQETPPATGWGVPDERCTGRAP